MDRNFLFLITALALAAWTRPAAAQIVPEGQHVRLTAEYEYVSNSSRQDKYDTQEWQVRRFAVLTATLKAGKPSEIPVLHKMEANKKAEIDGRMAAGQRAAKTMQPTMADMMAIASKCGEDEACMEREVTAYANKNRDAINQTREKVAPDFSAAAKQGKVRYQYWIATGEQRGRYDIAEKVSMRDADPICASHQGKRCRREESRIGSGQMIMPPDIGPKDPRRAGNAMFEIDSSAKDIMLILPIPLMTMAVKETINTDHPSQKSGESNLEIMFPPAIARQTIIVALKGTTMEQSGTKTIKINGASNNPRVLESSAPEDGTLTIRWHMKPL